MTNIDKYEGCIKQVDVTSTESMLNSIDILFEETTLTDILDDNTYFKLLFEIQKEAENTDLKKIND